MTVEELIITLKKYDGNLPVYVFSESIVGDKAEDVREEEKDCTDPKRVIIY